AFGETIAVLITLASAGFFPFDDHDPLICGNCPFARACRRGQAPAAARLEAAGAGRDFFLLRNKSTRAPLLRSSREAADDGGIS
ncbi:MAG TPA: hypothetical protein VFG08_07075, partial [Candidatus Polarisedimenticolia bacterium]|nr:hypothetical protein [Candidatus Polarisedimenticolia bacterium]